MYVPKELEARVIYKIGKVNNQDVAAIDVDGKRIANLCLLNADKDLEGCQRFIYSVAKSYIKMMSDGKSR